MPALANARHERFAVERMLGRSESAAYVTAGYSANSGNACRMNGNESVKARIGELMAESAEKSVAIKVDILARMLRVAEGAERDASWSAAARAYELLGKQDGLFTERREVAIDDARKLTGEELREGLLDAARALGLTGAALAELEATLGDARQVDDKAP